MNVEAFASKCPECGKKVYLYSSTRSAFCSRQCEANYNYRKKFKSSRVEDRPSWEDVRKLGVN